MRMLSCPERRPLARFILALLAYTMLSTIGAAQDHAEPQGGDCTGKLSLISPFLADMYPTLFDFLGYKGTGPYVEIRFGTHLASDLSGAQGAFFKVWDMEPGSKPSLFGMGPKGQSIDLTPRPKVIMEGGFVF